CRGERRCRTHRPRTRLDNTAERNQLKRLTRRCGAEVVRSPRHCLRRAAGRVRAVGCRAPQDIYLAHGADLTDTRPDINEAGMIRWVPLEAMRMVDRGEIVGAATVVGLYRA